jgi:hypothetical protein
MSAITAARGDLPYPEACIISHASVYLFAFHRTSFGACVLALLGAKYRLKGDAADFALMPAFALLLFVLPSVGEDAKMMCHPAGERPSGSWRPSRTRYT